MKNTNELSRSLTRRHVQMIAIGGAIGTGLFLGSGSTIQAAGPGIMLSYLVAGTFCFFLMRALGELLLSNLKARSFMDLIQIHMGDRVEFLVGWSYWLCWQCVAMADLTASGIYIRFWFPNVPQWLPPLIIIFLLLGMNLFDVKLFGEMEFWFSSIKVFAILALIATGAFMLLSQIKIGTHIAQLSNLTAHHGLFPKGVGGLTASLPMVVFAFAGIEMVGQTAGETANPKRDIPKAINTLPVRIVLFYIGSLFVLMCIYPWHQISTSQSPFVQVFSGLGIKSAAAIVNFVVLTAALSACNSAIFSTSRSVYTLAKSHKAPQLFAKTNKRNIPVTALLFSSCTLLIIVLMNYLIPSSIFIIISGVATVSFVFVWSVLVICHLKYRKSIKEEQLHHFRMPFYPISNYLTLLFFLFTLIIFCLNKQTIYSLICAIIWLVLLSFFYNLTKKKQK
ncbi:amino acid permease [Vagococcus entomophilus]|uniref:Amino acid permease n=1 Tax=Vagococcus entomophilus TaxID=1160095 RepID=A0A430AKR9_9ENTE|nr:amino acid permease [Vagococcus entomophilus]RSU08720.1 amino acid permease [Vagococcus entomophilus]